MLWRQPGRPAAHAAGQPRTRAGRIRPAHPLLLLLFLLPTPEPALAQIDFPALTGRVVDRAGILSEAVERRLTELLAEHEAETTNQVVVVTIHSLRGETIERYGRELGNHWGIGQAGRDNGVLLIVAMRQRKVRIEVGKGLQSGLTDDLAQAIIENEITPEFKRGDFEVGLYVGVDAVLRAIEGSYKAPRSYEAPRRRIPIWAIVFNPIVAILLAVVAQSLLLFLFKCFVYGTHSPFAERLRRQENDESHGWSWWSRVKARGYRDGGSPYSYGTDYGGFGGGSSFNGGGSSFNGGGGSFGGGGASGSW